MPAITGERIGDWIQTFTGRQFWPLDPYWTEVDIIDIAHALSMLCRYGGHSRRFYSVAEHSVLISHRVPKEHALFGLLHDAAEAYVVDVPRPLKHQLPDYIEIENNVHNAIKCAFGLRFAEPAEVKDADLRICVDEMRVLMVNRHSWRNHDNLEPLGVPISCWSPTEAERRFLERFTELTSC